MLLPESINEYLMNNIQCCFGDSLEVTSDDVEWFQDNFGIKNNNSAFIAFYTVVAFPPVGNGAELLPLETIIENAKLDQENDELPEMIGSKFLRLTSFEGEGAYYLDTDTDQVYDVSWGSEVDLVKKDHPKLASSFGEFLEQYYAKT